MFRQINKRRFCRSRWSRCGNKALTTLQANGRMAVEGGGGASRSALVGVKRRVMSSDAMQQARHANRSKAKNWAISPKPTRGVDLARSRAVHGTGRDLQDLTWAQGDLGAPSPCLLRVCSLVSRIKEIHACPNARVLGVEFHPFDANLASCPKRRRTTCYLEKCTSVGSKILATQRQSSSSTLLGPG